MHVHDGRAQVRVLAPDVGDAGDGHVVRDVRGSYADN
jgi:hypothetical protein